MSPHVGFAPGAPERPTEAIRCLPNSLLSLCGSVAVVITVVACYCCGFAAEAAEAVVAVISIEVSKA